MKTLTVILALALVLVSPEPALAYVGPGLGLGVLGVVLGVVFSIFLAFVGVVWYPIKRVFGLGKARTSRTGETERVEGLAARMLDPEHRP